MYKDPDIQLIQEFLYNLPTIEEEKKESFLDIAGYPNYENVISNIYSFFLQADKHGFDTLFIDALNDCIPDKDFSMSEYEVQREHITNNGGRIDIYIKEKADSDEAAKSIFIENKIYHTLENDLDDYYDSLPKNTDKTGIVLTLKAEDVPDRYYNITHKMWIEKVETRLGEYLKDVDLKHIALLQDFISHIKGFYEKHANMETIDFLFKNGKLIDKVYKLDENGITHISNELKKSIEQTDWNWSKLSGWNASIKSPEETYYLYFEFGEIFSEHTFQAELFIRGAKNILRWNETDYYKRTEEAAKRNNIELSVDVSKNKEWVSVATKEYPISDPKVIYDFNSFLTEILEEEWNPLVKALTTNFKVK